MAGQQEGDSLYEGGIGWAILLAVIAVVIWLFWLYNDTEVRNVVRWIRYAEMWLISHFVGDGYSIIYDGKAYNWRQGFEATARYEAGALSYPHLSYFTALSMQPLKLVFIAFFGLSALWVIFYGPNTHYRRKLGLEGLIAAQRENFPVISPFVNFNPAKQPPRPPGSPVPAELPPFAEALGPEEWLAYHTIPIPDGKIDEQAAARAFQKQLKSRWKGAAALEPYQQVLLACFCLKAARKRLQADDMLGRLAKCWTGKKGLQLSKGSKLAREARKILADKNLSGKTLAKANQHAFVTTALLSALQNAREEGGVLAPSTFVWLRAHDRSLWYPLNNLGRESFHMEALGAMAHYKAERMTGRPIPVPKMENAVKMIVEYMGSMRARPIPQLDYSNTKKRGVKKALD